MAEVIEAAEKAPRRQVPVLNRPPARETHTLIADPSRIHETLGWKPVRSSLEQILKDAWKIHSRR